jgi:hypothetical protein
MRLTRILLVAATALAGCAAGPQSGVPSGDGNSRVASGGAAGRMGPNYCQTVPSDLSERSRWNSLCFNTR